MSLVDQAPRFTLDEAGRLAVDIYGVKGAVKSLPSERDQNFLLTCDSGVSYVLKIANALEEHTLLDAQNQAMEHVAEQTGQFPKVVPSLRGVNIESAVSVDGQKHFLRLVTYLPGTPLGEIRRHSPELWFDLGRNLGILDRALRDFDHPALHRAFHWDLANGSSVIQKNAELIPDKKMREQILQFSEKFEQIMFPLLPALRKSVIYNDANDFNILVGGGEDIFSRNQQVAGFIDLGDMLYGYSVGDLAIGIAYAILNKPEPLMTAAGIVRGYHSEFALTEVELKALYWLVTLRMCMSVCIAAEQQKSQPANDYLGISQGPIRKTLPGWLQIHPKFAEAAFRQACDLPPFEVSPDIVKWLNANKPSFAQILPDDLRTELVTVFDLSVGSSLLNGDPRENIEPKLTRRLNEAMANACVKIGIGQYNEARYLTTAPAFRVGGGPTDETRTIHLGMDLFTQPGTPVRAPLDGKVIAFADKISPQDYGPVIVLEHAIGGGLVFFTLYGHLSRRSLEKTSVGKRIRKGSKFAEIGAADGNGGWPAHLHFQIITDLLQLGADFPGVAQPGQRELWTSLCPDPNLILGIPERVFPQRMPSRVETLAVRRRRLGGNLSIAYRSPLKIVRGWMQYLYDEQGRKYIDAYNNVAHVGHCHPRVVEAARHQIGVLNTNTRYLHDNINMYAERLISLMPDDLEVCYFVNSASEANELALRLARTFTRQRDMIVLEAAYHGNTTSLIDISPYKHSGPGGSGAPDWVHTVPIPDVFRGEHKANDPQAGVKYATHVKQVIEKLRVQKSGLAGFIAESLPSVAGQIVFPYGYLRDVYRYVREAGGLCIADEVQTGFGRVGSHMWGFEMQNVSPDIVVLGKPIGNGHPLAAVITRRDIAEAFDNGMEYFTTFGGNPVSCAIGLAVLDVVREEGLQEHAMRVGQRLLNGLKAFVGKYSMVADARGAGLFLGVEIVRNLSNLEPAAVEASFISNRMREHGILLGIDGPFHNVIKIRPPMPFNDADADYLLTTFEKILMEDFGSC